MAVAAIIFLLTYLVLGLQQLPRLHIGRPAGALLGAVAMVACGVLSFEEATAALDLDTILFLLGMMIILGYLELSGFFEVLERRVMEVATSPRALLLVVLGSAGVLSALFMNDTICLMLTPVVIRVTRRLGLPPVPYLIAVATGANVGSACTIVGNPQNALIGVRSGIPFLSFAWAIAPVSALGLLLAGVLLCAVYRPLVLQKWMFAAALASGVGLLVALSAGANPAAAAMTAAAAVIVAGATRPREALRRVDWSLLLLFGGLFVVMRGVDEAGLARMVVDRIAGTLEMASPAVHARLALAVAFLSQAVSNVPAVMLFVPTFGAIHVESAHRLWLALAAYSTLAGNLTILASVANLIVVEGARREGIEIGFVEYLKAGVPITVGTLALAWAGLLSVRNLSPRSGGRPDPFGIDSGPPATFQRRHTMTAKRVVLRAVLASFALVALTHAASPPAQPAEAAAKALMAKYAGSPDSGALLKEPAVRAQLQKLVGAQLPHLEQNLDVAGDIEVIGGTLSISGNAPHGGTEEEGVVCVAPMGPVVQAAIFSKGQVTVFAGEATYEYLLRCVKDWITLVNSGHKDRFEQPQNVRVIAPPPIAAQ